MEYIDLKRSFSFKLLYKFIFCRKSDTLESISEIMNNPIKGGLGQDHRNGPESKTGRKGWQERRKRRETRGQEINRIVYGSEIQFYFENCDK